MYFRRVECKCVDSSEFLRDVSLVMEMVMYQIHGKLNFSVHEIYCIFSIPDFSISGLEHHRTEHHWKIHLPFKALLNSLMSFPALIFFSFNRLFFRAVLNLNFLKDFIYLFLERGG